MKQWHNILEMAQRTNAQHVLGTVVDVMGSAYRRAGAHVLIAPDGTRQGMISGGCLDRDLVRHAWAWTQQGPKVALYDTRSDALYPQGRYGSGCEGIVQILLERTPTPTNHIKPLTLLRQVLTERQPIACATLYAGPHTPGLRLTLDTQHNSLHDPGFPQRLQTKLTPFLHQALTQNPTPYTWALAQPHHPTKVLIQVLRPSPKLVIFGAGEDAIPVARMATVMGWEVTVIDKWPALAQPSRFPGAQVHCTSPEDAIHTTTWDTDTYAVIMTHNLKDDGHLLPALLNTCVPWIGLMGPRRRTMSLMRTLAQSHQLPDPKTLHRVQSPVGLNLGGDSPEEVALSIISGLQAARNDRPGGFLRDRQGDIHPPQQHMEEAP